MLFFTPPVTVVGTLSSSPRGAQSFILSYSIACEYFRYLHARLFLFMHYIGAWLTVYNRHNITCETAVGRWVTRLLHFGGSGATEPAFVSVKFHLPFVICYNEVKYETTLSDLTN